MKERENQTRMERKMEGGYSIDLEQYSLAKFKSDLQSRELTPSRKELKQSIPESFDILGSMGIKNLQDIIYALKTKKKLEEFSKASGLPEDYLVLLKREANSYQPKPFNLNKIPGLDEGDLVRLKTNGIKNTRHLFHLGKTLYDRSKLSGQSGIPEDALLEMVKLSDLARIWGVGPVFARIFYDAGYDSVERVAGANPTQVYEEVVQLNKQVGYTRIMPSPIEVGMCIDYARLLPKTMEI